MLPTWPTNQRTSLSTKGDSRSPSSPGPPAATCCHPAASFAPTTGNSFTHSGGCGIVSVASDFDQPEISLAFPTMAPMPK